VNKRESKRLARLAAQIFPETTEHNIGRQIKYGGQKRLYAILKKHTHNGKTDLAAARMEIREGHKISEAKEKKGEEAIVQKFYDSQKT